ncbi:uncharacterized protein LOC141611536 [Silene latifolia]|uniref:uncharacterized protein LOC141611536 n=1 Tax=Silene latifolia TaxID=37657 RepID=UPI003D779883
MDKENSSFEMVPTANDSRTQPEDENHVKSEDANDVKPKDAANDVKPKDAANDVKPKDAANDVKSEDDDVESDDDDDDLESEDDDAESEDEDDMEGEEEDYRKPWLDGGRIEFQVRLYAEAALKYLNKQEGGKKYELVEPGPVYGATISRGPMLHFNFKAKPKDCPDAQVETFFVQMRMYKALVIDLCVSLGPSETLPHWRNAYVGGCRYCGDMVHHPSEKSEKLLWGVKGEDADWLYGKRQHT